ncbi:BtpA/SgcQ family protein [Desulfurococcaceae archaeon MEX13E-LK6-19]|nr:BtpA/SgcQ family protein [Desulfurococcaceae archaeon MEX13E-LK6-19]
MIDEGFFSKKPVIGVIHLPPLPGSPCHNIESSIDFIIDNAIRDAKIYIDNGVDAIILENFMDAPFAVRVLEPETLSTMSIIAWEIQKEIGKPIGINVLRNSGVEALSIACITGLDFIRVNALVEHVWAPEGLLTPIARDIMLKKKMLRCNVKVFADVNVKHGLSMFPLEMAIKETEERGMADALIVTGQRTGEAPSPGLVYYVKKISKKPVIIGSGVNLFNIRLYFRIADGFIVGTYFKKNGVTKNPVDPARVSNFMKIVNELRKTLSQDKH